jgi:hypothetical protein
VRGVQRQGLEPVALGPARCRGGSSPLGASPVGERGVMFLHAALFHSEPRGFAIERRAACTGVAASAAAGRLVALRLGQPLPLAAEVLLQLGHELGRVIQPQRACAPPPHGGALSPDPDSGGAAA